MLTFGDYDGLGFGDAASEATAKNAAAAAAAGRGESYTRPGVICDLALIQAQPGSAEDRWKAYCDCAFLEMHSRSQFTINGQVWPDNPQLTDAQYDAYLKPIIAMAQQQGSSFSLKVLVYTSRGAPDSMWHKCMSGLCGDTNGCYNPQKAASGATGDEAKDPFNVSPMMAWPPWDDVGAAVRGVPKRNANGWYTFGQLFSYDAQAYDPIKLWQIAWTNPGLYTLLGLKAGLIPFNPMLAYFVTGPVGLFPFTVGEIAKRYTNPNWGVLLFDVVGQGWIQFGKLAIKYISKCGFGIPGACGAGVVLKQVAEDQITTGEINNVLDPTSRAIIVFLAKYGDQLADRLFGLAEMAQHLRADPSLIAWFQQVFHMLQALPEIDAQAKLFLVLGEKLLGMAYAIALGIQQGASAGAVVDAGVNALLGFRPSLVAAMLSSGNIAGARTVVQQAATSTGLSIAQMGPLTASLIPSLQAVVKVLQDLNGKINGGLEDVISLFVSVQNALATASTSATNAVGQVTAGLSSPAPVATVAAPAALTRFATKTAIAASPAQVTTAAGGGGMLVVGAGVGFAVGGPAGAAIGGLLGALLGGK